MTSCVVEGCQRPIRRRGAYCLACYKRLRRHGVIPAVTPTPSPEERFWAQVEKGDDCWLWTGSLHGRPPTYGLIKTSGKTTGAHRFSYELHVGPIPDGYMVDHRCHVHRCVNPAHLRLATRSQNGENRVGPTRVSRSGVRGVVWEARKKLWRVQVRSHGRLYSGGRFKRLEDAESAAIELRNRLMTHNDVDRRAS